MKLLKKNILLLCETSGKKGKDRKKNILYKSKGYHQKYNYKNNEINTKHKIFFESKDKLNSLIVQILNACVCKS